MHGTSDETSKLASHKLNRKSGNACDINISVELNLQNIYLYNLFMENTTSSL